MLGRVLRLAEFEVAAFGSGEEFLDSLVMRVPACVILDVHMPGLSGFDAAARLRSAHHAVPIVFITASDDATLDRAASAAGGSALLRKPFPADTLLMEINAALRGKPTA